MKRLLVPIWAALCLTGCEAYDGIRTWVTFDPRTERMHVHARVENAGRSFFDCRDAEGCTDAIRLFTQGQADAAIPKAILALSGQGAHDLKVAIERDGDALDVLIWYQTLPGTRAAEVTGVGIERTGRGKKTRTRMVVAYGDSRHIEGQDYERRIHYAPTADQTGIDAHQTWLLHKKATEVTVWEEPLEQTPVTPILTDVPGLADALERGGVI